MIVKVFGAVHINCSSAPTTKEEFIEKYIGKVPDIEEAWKEVSKNQPKKETLEVEKPKRKRRKKKEDE